MKFKILLLCGLLALTAPSPVFASALLKPTSGVTQALSAKSLDVSARIDGAFARTTLTTIYKNPNSRRIEADFIYSAPKGSVVTGFAYWFGKEKVVARVVEKRRAARIYSYITTRQQDPALIEMIGKNSFRARIFPVEANQDLKIEVQLAQKLDSTREQFVWNYPLGEETKTPLESLKVHLQSDDRDVSAQVGTSSNRFADGKFDFERENVSKLNVLRVAIPRNPVPLRASLLARRESASGDGFFALSLSSSSPVALPRLKISGVSTYDVLAPSARSLKAFEPFVVFGRYRKGGKAIVALNNQSVSLDFGDKVETRNVAASFWAQTRIETLSDSTKNQSAVVNLSKRFGLVSKWTSWLAIPNAERARFQREVDEADRANSGRAYAQAIARSDRKTAAAQKIIFAKLSKKVGETAPISDFLNSELEIVSRSIESAKYDKKQRVNLSNWRKLQRVLLQNGARRDRDEYAAQRRANEEMRALAPLYVAAVENKNAAGARRFKNRLKALSRIGGSNEFSSYVSGEASQRNQKLAQSLALERAENRLSARRERDLIARIQRIVPLSQNSEQKIADVLQSGQQSVVEQKTAAARAAAKNAITFGKPLSEVRRDFDAQWSAWEKRVGAQNLGRYNADNTFKSAIEARLSSEIRAGRDLESQNVQLSRDLKDFQKKTNNSNSYQVRQAYGERASEVAKQLVDEQLANGAETTRAETLKSEVARLTAASNYRDDFYIRNAASKVRSEAKIQIADEVAKYAENSPQARAAQQKLDKLKAIDATYANSDGYYDGNNSGDYDLDKTWRGRAHETAYRLLEAQEKTPSDASRIAQLETDLQLQAQQVATKPDAFTDWEAMRRKNGEPLLTAQEYRVRWGDPLISVLAPANCQQVVAIMPDGTLLPLAYDFHKKSWEARFDVPTWASEGDYKVQILIVSQDGARKRLTMNFALDVSTPEGAGTVQSDGKTWKLQLQSDGQSDRVSAFLPWNERVELRRNESGIFSGEVAVPAQFAAQKTKVRFILTDKAHNRTEIWVDSNR
ncbi:VIT domain-containing protein [Abditibacterium utsteinense]|nr:VIT domain-containing protein [Abditibacterium utsteinense]